MPQESIPNPECKTLSYPHGKTLLNRFPNPYPNAKNTPREETATGDISQYNSLSYKWRNRL